MTLVTGFSNAFNSGEISSEAWERTDLQPILKGCELGINTLPLIAGPLGKRRGFWDLGAVADQTKVTRLVPFKRNIDDALMLEFGDLTVSVFAANGAPVLSGGVPVTFASPYTAAQLAGLRYKQVADVIYFRHASGLPLHALSRITDVSWTFNAETLKNGPWRNENIDRTSTITITGAQEVDANNATNGSILAGAVVTLAASAAIFNAGHVGACFRLRQTTGGTNSIQWTAGYQVLTGAYNQSVGRVYVANPGTYVSGDGVDHRASNPPVQFVGDQSDGLNNWTYRHDGAGVVLITAFTDAHHVTGTVINGVPLLSGGVTSYWSEGAYSDYRGWPRAWPELREERLVGGATAGNLDMVDITQTAGFGPDWEDYTPGLGTGQVVATNAVRARLGKDGAEIVWFCDATYLMAATTSGIYLVAGSVLDEPISPTTVRLKRLFGFGAADAAPVDAWEGLLYIVASAQTVRKLSIDTAQNPSSEDLGFLATHLGKRLFKQLAWVSEPEYTCWARLGDGGLAAFVWHEEQQSKGWTTQALPGGWTCEDLVSLPGPGRLPTLWMTVSRVKGGVTQRRRWMYSALADSLYLDGAQAYAGAPATVIAGLDAYEGETVRVVADGGQIDGLVVAGGSITLPAAASKVQVGLAYQVNFRSLKGTIQPGAGVANQRQRLIGAIVSVLTVGCHIGGDGGKGERVDSRRAADLVPTPRRCIHEINFAESTGRDPRVVITEDSAFPFTLYSIKAKTDASR